MFRFNGWLVLAAVSSTALLAACVQMAPSVLPRIADRATIVTSVNQQPTLEVRADVPLESAVQARATATARPGALATPIPNPLANRQFVVARRGLVQEKLQLPGRVIPVREAPLAFSINGTVARVGANPGDAVRAGQSLLVLDTADAAQQLKDISAELQITRAKLDQLAVRDEQTRRQQLADAQAQQATDAARRQSDQVRIADATVKAQEQLHLVQVNLERVKAGPPATDRLAAEGALATAQGSLAKAQTDLDRLQSGPTPAERRTAEQLVASARIAQKKAQTEYDKLVRAPDASLLATARKEVAAAQADVERASATDNSPNAPKLSGAERQSRQQAAAFALKAANEQLAALQKGPDKATIDLARMAVDSAQVDLAGAQTHLQELTAPPTPDQINAAALVVDAARLGLEGAEARLAELKSHPTAEELRVAQKGVDDAQQALEHAADPVDYTASNLPTSTPPASPQPADTGSSLVDRLTLLHTLDGQQARAQALQAQVAASQMTAPFDGLVESVQVKSGDAVDARHPVLVLASGGAPIVSADLPAAYASRLTTGANVSLRLDASNADLSGTLVDLGDSTAGSSRPALVQVSWAEEAPKLGSNVQVTVVVSERPDALLIPQRAVTTSGDRRTVEVLVGQERRTVEVKLGLASGNEVEVTSGIADGQTVVMPN